MKSWRHQHRESLMNRTWSVMNFDGVVVWGAGKMGERGKKRGPR